MLTRNHHTQPHFDAMSSLVSGLLEAPHTARADNVFYMEFLTAVTYV